MKVCVVFGTRPEAIKLAPVINQLQQVWPNVQVQVCVTAQHRQMLDQVLEVFDIKPDYDFNIMKQGQDLFNVTVSVMLGLKEVFRNNRPDIVMVQGDTTTAFAAGLAAFYEKLEVAHVEAGLRTYMPYNPFPEEINRHLLSVISNYHFAPTEWARDNLIKEHIEKEKIWVTGNTVIDALLMVIDKHNEEQEQKRLTDYFKQSWQIDLSKHAYGAHSNIILITGHRRESFGEGFKNICEALKEIALINKNILMVYPVHLNPNVQKPVRDILQNISNIRLIEPLEYEPFVYLMKHSMLILTDSGGIQEEAPSLGIPVLVMRQNTERPEGLYAGTVKLVGTDRQKIIDETLQILDNPSEYRMMSKSVNPYGDGQAAKRIAKILIDTYTKIN